MNCKKATEFLSVDLILLVFRAVFIKLVESISNSSGLFWFQRIQTRFKFCNLLLYILQIHSERFLDILQ